MSYGEQIAQAARQVLGNEFFGAYPGAATAFLSDKLSKFGVTNRSYEEFRTYGAQAASHRGEITLASIDGSDIVSDLDDLLGDELLVAYAMEQAEEDALDIVAAGYDSVHIARESGRAWAREHLLEAAHILRKAVSNSLGSPTTALVRKVSVVDGSLDELISVFSE